MLLPAAVLTERFCPFEWQYSPALSTASPIVPLSVDERSVLLLRLIPMLYVPGSTSCTCWGPLEEVAHPAVKQATLAAKPRIDTILIEIPTPRGYFFSSVAVMCSLHFGNPTL